MSLDFYASYLSSKTSLCDALSSSHTGLEISPLMYLNFSVYQQSWNLHLIQTDNLSLRLAWKSFCGYKRHSKMGESQVEGKCQEPFTSRRWQQPPGDPHISGSALGVQDCQRCSAKICLSNPFLSWSPPGPGTETIQRELPRRWCSPMKINSALWLSPSPTIHPCDSRSGRGNIWHLHGMAGTTLKHNSNKISYFGFEFFDIPVCRWTCWRVLTESFWNFLKETYWKKNLTEYAV